MNIKKSRLLVSLAVASLVFVGCGEQPQPEVVIQKSKQDIELKKQKIINSVNNDFNNKIDFFAPKVTNIVYDSSTNLMWQDDIRVKTIKKNWQDSIEYCKSLNFKTYSDWRLPTKSELITIVDKNRYPSIKKEFNNSSFGIYWSSTTYSTNIPGYINFAKTIALGIEFNHGHDKQSDKVFNSNYIRCLRTGQLVFDFSENLKLYKSAGGKKNFQTKNNYFEKPFKEIQKLSQRLVNMWIVVDKIKKPKLPPMPKLIKDEYETKAQFQTRVNDTIAKREARIKQLQEKYRKDVEFRNEKVKYVEKVLPQKIKEWQKNAFNVVMGGFEFQKRSYDAEAQTMYLTMKAKMADYSKKVAIKVPLTMAKSFGENIQNVKANPVFDFKNNQIVLNRIEANYDGNTMLATLNSKDFKPENITVAIKDKKVKFDSASQMRLSLQNPNLKDTYQVEALAYKDGKEIKGVKFDDDIPSLLTKIKQTKIDSKKWLFIVGIENYAETDNIKYSKRSAEAFKKVAKKTLGISERHSYTLIDNKATGTAIKNRLRLLLSEVKKGDTIYFYYNGHGIPDPKNSGEPYMLPSDGIADFIVSEKEFALKNIYKQLSDSKASKIVAFVDSCFSGATDGVSIIKGVAGSRLAPKKVVFNKSKMAVITAGQKKQYSNMFAKKGHRLFSYFVMKSLLDGKKDINLLYKEVSYKVSNKSNEFGVLKKQEPTIDGNLKIRL